MIAVERPANTAGAKRAGRIVVSLIVVAIVLGLGAWYFIGSIASPSGLNAASTHGTKIALEWTDTSDNEDGFIIERRVSNGAFSEIARVAPGVTSYADADVEIGAFYEYRVRAFRGWMPGFAFRRSGSSNEASVTVAAAPVIEELVYEPQSVEGGNAAMGGVTIDVSSTDSADVVAVEAGPAAVERHQLTAQRVQLISQLTGPGSPSRTDERWNIAGTDLGFSFKHRDKLYMVFGDTWGRDGVQGADWRSNTMAIAEPHPDHGYVIADAVAGSNGEAKELLRSLKVPKEEYTVIPTAGIAVDDRMYLHYMSINYWDQHDWGYQEPVLNGSGLAYSDDGGQTWVKDETAWWPGNSDFGQAAMVKRDGYVYMFGTPAGRFGPAKLLRVAETELLNPAEYEYWTGDIWESDPAMAAEVVPAPVGELSVRWSDHHQQWFMMYLNDITHTIVLRTASQLTGPWSDEEIIVTAAEYPHLYAPFMLPIEGEDIYFTMSIFQPDYQVFLMKMTP